LFKCSHFLRRFTYFTTSKTEKIQAIHSFVPN
jgi:hypothetical protein